MYARQRSFSTAATSIRYGRPPMDSSKRWTTVFTVSAKKTGVERCALYGLLRRKQAKRRTKTRPHSSPGSFLDGNRREKKLTFSVAAQEIHRSSTGFAQADVLPGPRCPPPLEPH